MMKLKLKEFCTIAGLLSILLTSTAHAETVLSWTDGAPNRGTRADATIWMAEELAKRTNGELKMEFHWGGALMKFKAATKGIGAGAADMGLMVAIYNPKLHLGYTIADLPTKYSDPWVGTRSIYELVMNNEELQKEFHKLNLQYISNITTTQIEMICKDKVVRDLDDIKGLKVRGISIYGKVLADLGAIPVGMPSSGAYQGLSTGLIDCTLMYGYAIPAFKLQEVGNEFTRLDWGALMSMAYVMNKDVFDALTPEQQEIILQLGSDFVDHYAEKIIAGNAKAYELMAAGTDGKNKVNFHEISPEAKAELEKATQPYVEVWRKEAEEGGIDANAMQRQFHELLKNYDDERKSKGYPWNR
ncbi:MAG: C4-dicarboxylate TRAP transporter substrate-binding protein [Rhodobacteraceae bacterium]|nr:C4-dicarboxylate TRAP transporter substrate-binding protein [Paracoccaceae bacterium]